jgi:hypothetical protein
MHLLLLILKYRPHLELEWLCATAGLGIMGAVTMDLTTIILAVIALCSTIFVTYYTFQTAKLKEALADTGKKVDDLKQHVNSRMDKMIEAIEIAALAKGHLAGVESEKQRRALQDQDRAKGEAAVREKKPDSDAK